MGSNEMPADASAQEALGGAHEALGLAAASSEPSCSVRGEERAAKGVLGRAHPALEGEYWKREQGNIVKKAQLWLRKLPAGQLSGVKRRGRGAERPPAQSGGGEAAEAEGARWLGARGAAGRGAEAAARPGRRAAEGGQAQGRHDSDTVAQRVTESGDPESEPLRGAPGKAGEAEGEDHARRGGDVGQGGHQGGACAETSGLTRRKKPRWRGKAPQESGSVRHSSIGWTGARPANQAKGRVPNRTRKAGRQAPPRLGSGARCGQLGEAVVGRDEEVDGPLWQEASKNLRHSPLRPLPGVLGPGLLRPPDTSPPAQASQSQLHTSPERWRPRPATNAPASASRSAPNLHLATGAAAAAQSAAQRPTSPFVATGQQVLHRRSSPREIELDHLERALQSQMAQLESQLHQAHRFGKDEHGK
ncbi:unnamed protein product [Prorocentrum cordatum]|uniref:Uncharacterized protein n=1 Tax=Prorocentrum cordatum TaxID=2364126 RepID=A0ABN9PIU0_9DINO|nr:unnamed protein product [Polarella glacialis]